MVAASGLLVGAVVVRSLPDIAAAAPPPPSVRMAMLPVPAAPPAVTFGHPVDGYPVVSPFGRRKLPWEAAARLHGGVDIAAPWGAPVRAVADGTVTRAGRDSANGRFVEIRHLGGLSSVYAHLGAVADEVRPGAPVRLGAPIGRIGNSGASTGSHLHLEIHDPAGQRLNPALFLGRSFALATDLPLAAARRIPPGVRVAWVSVIPKSRRQAMEADARDKALVAERRAAELQLLPASIPALPAPPMVAAVATEPAPAPPLAPADLAADVPDQTGPGGGPQSSAS